MQALIFDVDGTLAETERDAHRVAFNQAFAEAALADEWDPELYGELLAITGGKERIRHYWTEHQGEPEPDAELVRRLHERKQAFFTELVRTGQVPPRSGILRLLNQARQAGVRLAIATTTSREPLLELLAHTLAPEAADWFEVIVAGDEVDTKKPAPDAYDRAVSELGLEPAACLAVEDSPPGVEAARAAGVPVVVTESKYNAGKAFPGALAVLARFGEPDTEPARVVAGDLPLPAHRAVDLEALRRLHAGAGSGVA